MGLELWKRNSGVKRDKGFRTRDTEAGFEVLMRSAGLGLRYLLRVKVWGWTLRVRLWIKDSGSGFEIEGLRLIHIQEGWLPLISF